MKQDRRGSWYILTGVVLGLALGLAYSWMVSPVKYIDAPPYSLREDFKEQYRLLVAMAYLYNGDLLRAQDRLAQLKDDNISQTITMQAQRALAEGHPEEEVKALNLLAAALSEGPLPASINPDSALVIASIHSAGARLPNIESMLSAILSKHRDMHHYFTYARHQFPGSWNSILPFLHPGTSFRPHDRPGVFN